MHWQQLGGIGECIEHVLGDYWRLVLVNCIGELYWRIVLENCMGEVIWEALWSSIGPIIEAIYFLLGASQILENKAVRKKHVLSKGPSKEPFDKFDSSQVNWHTACCVQFFLNFWCLPFPIEAMEGESSRPRKKTKDRPQEENPSCWCQRFSKACTQPIGRQAPQRLGLGQNINSVCPGACPQGCCRYATFWMQPSRLAVLGWVRNSRKVSQQHAQRCHEIHQQPFAKALPRTQAAIENPAAK